MTALISGLVLGLASSMHCVLMCGPIALVFRTAPGPGARTGTQVSRAALYHGSRIATYGALGLAAGTAGRAAGLSGLGAWVSVICGTLLVGAALGVLRPVGGRGRSVASGLVAQAWARAIRMGKGRPYPTAVVAGALNGVLPCGMTYAALAAAMATGHPLGALTFMLAFGAGTLPLLAAVWMASPTGLPTMRGPGRGWLRPATFAVVGLLLIGRGLNLAGQLGPAPAPAVHAHGHQAP
jgi:sulfite exporter TauE/SafE